MGRSDLKDNQFSGNWTEAQTLRDELFRRAATNEITGDEADAEAIRLGIGRLSTIPEADEFDAGRQAQWTLPMAVAWIAYRDLRTVSKWSVPYCERYVDWRWKQWRVGTDGPILAGWKLEQHPSPTVSLLGMISALRQETGEDAPVTSIREAQEGLWVALREDFFSASGIDQNTGLRVSIAALEWNELVLVQGRGGVDEVRRGLLGAGYRDVLLPSVALRGYWQPDMPRTTTLPPLMPPAGDGYMPLYCAAQWIATEGGAIDFNPEEPTVWQQSYKALLDALSSDKVRAVGTRDGSREPLPGHLFADCEVDYPFIDPSPDLHGDPTLHLRSYPYDQDLWRRGFDDALVRGVETRWSRIMLAKEDVQTRWPFSLLATSAAIETSGYPGRPAKSKHLIEAEFQRRVMAGELADTLAVEAVEAIDWLRREHPLYPAPSVETVKNNLRAMYRRAKETK